LKQAGASTGQTLAWDGTQWAPSGTGGSTGGVSLVSVLPGAPSDGQTVVYTDSLTTPTFTWQLIYVQAVSKWCFIGGIPKRAFDGTAKTSGAVSGGGYSGTWADVESPGVSSITLPNIGGTFQVTAELFNTIGCASANGFYFAVAPKFGAAPTQISDSLTADAVTHDNGVEHASRTYVVTMVATDVVKFQFQNANRAAQTKMRALSVIPLQVS